MTVYVFEQMLLDSSIALNHTVVTAMVQNEIAAIRASVK